MIWSCSKITNFGTKCKALIWMSSFAQVTLPTDYKMYWSQWCTFQSQSVDLFINFICIKTHMRTNIEKRDLANLNYGQTSILETTEETYKLKENQLKCDPYTGAIQSSIDHYWWQSTHRLICALE